MYNKDIMGLFDKIEQLSQNLDNLIEKAELWQLLFDECPDAIAVFNLSMNFFLINREFCELVGYSSEELVGQNISLVLPSNFCRVHKQYEREFARKPEKKVNRHGLSPIILTRKGTVVPIDIDLSFFYHDNKCYYTAFIRRLSE
jgi:PAS domain S-box-containing protein